jgi:hypothetical protein
MTSRKLKKDDKQRSLGIHPEFEGIVMPREISVDGGKSVREAILWDTAEYAFAHFSSWPEIEKQRKLIETLTYIHESENNKNHLELPILEKRYEHHSDLGSVDAIAEIIWRELEIGVKRRHEGMDKFLTRHAISDADFEPYRTKGNIWRAKVNRRGDERLERSRDVRLWDAEITINGFDIEKMGFRETSPIYTENFGRERRHGNNSGSLFIAGYHVSALNHYIKGLKLEKKLDLKLGPDYEIFYPFEFEGNENLVVEAIARRYLPIYYKQERERNIFSVSAFLNDHPEIFSKYTKKALEDSKAFLGVGKLLFEDFPHRNILDSIDDFFVKEQSYKFNGFAVDFRDYGQNYETVSTVYTKPDKSRSVHVIYDGKFEVPPMFLFKMRRGAWEDEQRSRGRTWNLYDKPQNSPFENLGRWNTDFDRHTQIWMVNRIVRPDKFVLEQYRNLILEYNRFENKINSK